MKSTGSAGDFMLFPRQKRSFLLKESCAFVGML
jgi:hypothetical protein